MKSKVSFSQIFINSFYKFQNVFDLFEASLGKVILYFLLLNFMMFLPITTQVVSLSDIDYSRYGFTFHKDVPDWLPNELPSSCKIESQQLTCETDYVFEYQIMNRDTLYTIYFNVSDPSNYTEDATIIFHKDGFNMNFSNGRRLELNYRGFGYTDFAEVRQMSQEDASDLLFESVFQSIKPVLILPLILLFVGILTVTNIILIVALAAISMLFSINLSNFPKFKNMIKLMIFASTIPSIINLILGFYGLSAFTSISYNFITPIIAFFMFKRSRMLEETK
ncbi:MAG: DUF1189 domain-containing protein [Candidatus Izimaplasma sp.]|nr:DUF1189 domain-containing protein [Candidatus Izimaplasma bacterium]